MLAGESKSSVNMSVNGITPAIFAGIDPSDNQFFVAKKSVFNKNPILYKNHLTLILGDILEICSRLHLQSFQS